MYLPKSRHLSRPDSYRDSGVRDYNKNIAMTRPITPPRQDINRTTIQPRPQSVAFSYLLTHETICLGLTIVNKPVVNNLLSMHCKDMILLTVKSGNSSVNNRTPVSSMRQLKMTRPTVSSGRASITELTYRIPIAIGRALGNQ